MNPEYTVDIKDHIAVFENAFSKEYCDTVIKVFETLDGIGFSLTRQQHDKVVKTEKDDKAIFATSVNTEHVNKDVHQYFLEEFWKNYYAAYAEKYAILHNGSGPHTIYANKLQRTEIGGGYHVWHYEASNRETSNRLLAYILYLNDVEDGGETEFLYQHRRVKPKAGTLVIFPASFTHTHRGNPPLSNAKYIMTGWVDF